MAGEWQRICLANAVEIISGGTPKTTIPDYWGGDIPWLSVSDFNTGYRWVCKAEKSITERGLSQSATTLLDKGDIIISARGTVGVVAQLARPMAFNQSCYGVRGKRGIAETDFVYYLLRHVVSDMKQVAHGGVFDTITRDTFRIIECDLPPLPEQRAIAQILGTLDDKIELNRRMSETLEAMARALFKAWFVDFEPVRAKMNLPSPSGRGAGGEGRSATESTAQQPSSPGRGAGGEGKKSPLPTVFVERARELRKRTTDAEQLLWQLLRNRQIAGAKFRRQHPIPPYILDFYCHEHRLAVEIDGWQHNQPVERARDTRRTEFLAQQGIRVLRFWNHEVLSETEAVLQVIYDAVVGSSPHPGPLPEGEGRYPHPNPLPEGEGMTIEGEGIAFGGEFRWPQHILDLFPDRLVQSELGEIPEGVGGGDVG
jgi:very-short-patch-repair endonuclease